MTQLETLQRIAGRDARYRKHLPPGVEPIPPTDGKTVTVAPSRTPLPCIHEGPIVEWCKSCNGDGRHVRACLHPSPSDPERDTCTRAFVSDKVQACERCPDRQAEAAAGQVLVPQPPPLSLLTRRHSRALVTVAVGDEGRKLLAVSGPYMKAYAERVGADFVVLDWPGHTSWKISAKFAIPRVLDHYERIAYVDADVLLRPAAVNLFDLCAPDEFGAHDELPHHRQWKTNESYTKRYLKLRHEMGFGDCSLHWYFNAGVMVVPRSAAKYLLPPTSPMPVYHCAEQDHTNANILDAYRRGELKVRLLDRRANWQNWTDGGFKEAPPDAILHWSGSGIENRRRRAEEMASWAEKYPLPLEGPGLGWIPPETLFPELHRHYTDLRHVRWLRNELMTGRYRRVLEIGCFHGYSTCAFLDAAKDGLVDEVHLCDTEIRPELERVIEHYSLGDCVKVHSQRSTDLLATDSQFDLVFVDGDHTRPVVKKEARLLLAAGVRAVFVHDTAVAANKRYRTPTGPRILAKAFRSDPRYEWAEDAVERPGERTERGMFLARRLPIPPLPPTRPRLTIIVPSLGRPTLGRALESITSQMYDGDELVVERDATGDVGGTPRTRGQSAATGDYILFMDDDDIYLPGALDLVRKSILEQPGRVHLFAMSSGVGWELPQKQYGREVRVTNVSTQMVVLPNDPKRMGVWGARRKGDYDFIASLLSHYQEGPVWHDEQIAVWRPSTGDNKGKA